MLHFEKILKIKLEDIPDFSHNATKEFARLTGEILKAKTKLKQLYGKYAVKKSDIDEYRKEKFSYLQYKFEKDNDSST